VGQTRQIKKCQKNYNKELTAIALLGFVN